MITRTVVRIMLPVVQWNVIENGFEREGPVSFQTSEKQLLYKYKIRVTSSRDRESFEWTDLVSKQVIKLETEGFKCIYYWIFFLCKRRNCLKSCL